MSELSAVASTPDSDVPADEAVESLAPLVVGTTLIERYTIVQVVSSQNEVNVYRVAEMRRCLNCGVENEGNLTECGFCGNELPLPRRVLLTETRTPADGQVVPTSFMLDGLTYRFSRDEDQHSEPVKPARELDVSFASDPGLARGTRGEPNEDSVLVLQLSAQHATVAPRLGLFMLGDGVGGAELGELASEMTVQIVAHHLMSNLLDPNPDQDGMTDEILRETLRAAVARANTQVLDYAHVHDAQLGSTLTLALVMDAHAYFANVGDSRAYLYRDHVLTQITRDHSFVAQLISKGEITAEEARVHPQRNLILRSLGDASGFDPDIFPQADSGMELRAGDQILLCSDGLWEMVLDQEIAQILAQASDAKHACAQLISFANAAGGADNITVIVVRVA